MDSEKKDYIIQEAEAIVAECIRQIEEDSKDNIKIKENTKIEKNHKKVKSVISAIIVIETILCIIFAIK